MNAPATQLHEFLCVLANAATTSLRFLASLRLCVKLFSICENPFLSASSAFYFYQTARRHNLLAQLPIISLRLRAFA